MLTSGCLLVIAILALVIMLIGLLAALIAIIVMYTGKSATYDRAGKKIARNSAPKKKKVKKSKKA